MKNAVCSMKGSALDVINDIMEKVEKEREGSVGTRERVF